MISILGWEIFDGPFIILTNILIPFYFAILIHFTQFFEPCVKFILFCLFVKCWNLNIWKGKKNQKKNWFFGLQLLSILLFICDFLFFQFCFRFLFEVFLVIIMWGMFNRRYGWHIFNENLSSLPKKNHHSTWKVLHSVLLL